MNLQNNALHPFTQPLNNLLASISEFVPDQGSGIKPGHSKIPNRVSDESSKTMYYIMDTADTQPLNNTIGYT